MMNRVVIGQKLGQKRGEVQQEDKVARKG